ncbi:MAG TPA: hypothetical protein VH165_36535 [Kofleriaceae bacterium]|jgi:hypothetical protein|nr:hypothetical protein [Kofleriaceae bacterium]
MSARRIPCSIVVALAGLAACGDNFAAPDVAAVSIDAPAVAVAPPCKAVFSDNFVETWSGPTGCATLAVNGDTTLGLSIPSQTLGVPFAISIDLGAAPGTGTYTSETLTTPWSVDALHEFDMTSCLYHAGTAAVPPGTFKLELDAVEPTAHGTLELELYVLARPYTYCGETSTEHMVVTF